MRRSLATALIFSTGILFQAGCGGVGVRLGPSGGSHNGASSSPSWPDPNMDPDSIASDPTPFIVGAVALAAAGLTYLAFFKNKRDKKLYALTPQGEQVRLLVHAEAPEDAVYLGDLETGTLSRLEYVRNDLRNRAARLGGDLVVLDDILQDVYNGRTNGYVGCGRAYKTRAHHSPRRG